MIMKKSLLIAISLLACFGCNKNEKKDRGFIVFINPREWYFVPANSLSENSCSIDFSTENLGLATQFRPAFDGVNYIQDVLDTIKLDVETAGLFTYDPNRLKIAPVEMEYEIEHNMVEKTSASKFQVEVQGKLVQFNYNLLPVKITRVTPLFCFNRKKSDVKVCDCKKSEDDTDDYLYKICMYLKEKGDKSFQPCKYKVTKITESTYEGKKAIEVVLNCCYMGDRAYFDPQTKELITFSFSPE